MYGVIKQTVVSSGSTCGSQLNNAESVTLPTIVEEGSHLNDIFRPKSVDERKTRGHWEIDTVMGKGSKHCVVTLVKRMTGYTLIGQLDDRTPATLNKRTIKLMSKFDGLFTTITADNGTEFHQ